MNYNYYQNPNNGYSFSNNFYPSQQPNFIYPQKPLYYYPYNSNSSYFQPNSLSVEQNINNTNISRAKSVDNLINYGENINNISEKVKIGDRIKLTNKQNSPEKYLDPNNKDTTNNNNKSDIIKNEISHQQTQIISPPITYSTTPVKFENKKSFSDNTIPNNYKYSAFSNDFLSKKVSIPKQEKEEDVLSEDSKKNNIRSPMPIKINQKEMNEKLIDLESKKQELEALIDKNSALNSQYKLLLENKAKFYVVEKLIEENQKLNSVISAKMIEIAKIIKNSQQKYENPQKKTNKILESLEIRNLELKTELKETELLFIKKLYLLKKHEEQMKKLSNIKEEIQIKELTLSIQKLTENKNSYNDKKTEIMKFLFFQIEELFQNIKKEYQKT